MKTKSQTVRIAFWVLLGIVILVSSLALNRPLPLAQEATTTPTASTDRVTTAEARDDVGSTDGIMLMAVVIVLIVIIPILIRWQAWSNRQGKR